jgi:hypothetical protein
MEPPSSARQNFMEDSLSGAGYLIIITSIIVSFRLHWKIEHLFIEKRDFQ